MNYINNAAIIKRQVMVRLAKLILDDTIQDNIDLIPVLMTPKNSESVRCCIHHDRAVVRSRVKVLLGFAAASESQSDEVKLLKDYAADAVQKGEDRFDESILTVIDDACSACIRSKYQVTNACRGCVARPCIMNCPKKAIRFEGGHAIIDENLCVSCGICEKVCPYHAIVYQPIPCEEACPVNAISKDEFGKEKIDPQKCVYCGKCMLACPFGAIMERSEMFDVLRDIKDPGKTTVAMVAPSIAGQFNTDFGKVVSALKKMGFDKVVEVAYGADITAQKETEEFVERLEHKESFMTSSCCPAYVQVVKKHIPSIQSYVSTTLSPMIYTGEWVSNQWPGATRVFIGPCVAKRFEARESTYVDNVMTYEELGSIFIAAGVDVVECDEQEPDKSASPVGRGFAVSGGVANAVIASAASCGVKAVSKPVNGINNKTVSLLRVLDKTIKEPAFVEVMTCEGGCLNGPGVTSSPVIAKKFLEKMLK